MAQANLFRIIPSSWREVFTFRAEMGKRGVAGRLSIG